MSLLDLARLGRSASALAVGWLIVSAAPALSQTALKFSLDGKLEGPAAIFLVPQDKGYYQHESIDVTIDEGATPRNRSRASHPAPTTWGSPISMR